MISSTYKVLCGYKNLFNFEGFLNISAKSTVFAVTKISRKVFLAREKNIFFGAEIFLGV